MGVVNGIVIPSINVDRAKVYINGIEVLATTSTRSFTIPLNVPFTFLAETYYGTPSITVATGMIGVI